MERIVDGMGPRFDDSSRFGNLAARRIDRDSMAIDVVEDEDAYVATVDLPGFEHDDIHVSVGGDLLEIEAIQEELLDKEETRYLHRERHSRSMSRSISLPSAVVTDDVRAGLNNGVLTLTLPKVELDETAPVEIDVE